MLRNKPAPKRSMLHAFRQTTAHVTIPTDASLLEAAGFKPP